MDLDVHPEGSVVSDGVGIGGSALGAGGLDVVGRGGLGRGQAFRVLGPDSIGPLRIGMTEQEAMAAVPELVVTEGAECRFGRSELVSVYLNPDGRVSWISPGVPAVTPGRPAGGMTVATAFDLYRPGELPADAQSRGDTVFPVPGAPGSRYDIWVEDKVPGSYGSSIIKSISLDGGQTCAG